MKKVLRFLFSTVLVNIMTLLCFFVVGCDDTAGVDKTKDYLLTVKTEQLEIDGRAVRMGYAYSSHSEAVRYGTEVWVAATPVGGYEFEGWYKGNKKVSEDKLYKFPLKGNTALVAKFSEVKKGDFILPKEDLNDPDLKDKVLSGESEYFKISTIINQGDDARIAKVIRKAKNGEDIYIVGIGGSITLGLKNGYVSYGHFVSDWLQELFPDINVCYINAGIGSTGSDVGVHRLEADVISCEPDLVFVEFSVNDISLRNQGWPFETTYEAIIRRLLENDISTIAVVNGSTDYTEPKFYDTALTGHLPTLLYYDVPVIDYYGALWRYIDAGIIKWFDFDTAEDGSKIHKPDSLTTDGLHPSEVGHKITAASICYYLNNVIKNLNDIDDTVNEIPEEMFFSDIYKTATFYASDAIYSPYYEIVEGTSITGEVVPAHVHGKKLGTGWKCKGAGSSITFEFKDVKSVYIFLAKNTTDFGKGTVTINGETVLDNVSTENTANHIWPYYNKLFDEPTDVTITFTCNEGIFGFAPIGIAY